MAGVLISRPTCPVSQLAPIDSTAPIPISLRRTAEERTAPGVAREPFEVRPASVTAQLVAHAEPATLMGRKPQWPKTKSQLKKTSANCMTVYDAICAIVGTARSSNSTSGRRDRRSHGSLFRVGSQNPNPHCTVGHVKPPHEWPPRHSMAGSTASFYGPSLAG